MVLNVPLSEMMRSISYISHMIILIIYILVLSIKYNYFVYLFFNSIEFEKKSF